MPLYTYTGTDSATGSARRAAVRPRHLAHLEPLAQSGRIRFAGPLLDETGTPCGSLVIVEAPDLASARRVAEADPYLLEGVFERVDVRETRQVLPAE